MFGLMRFRGEPGAVDVQKRQWRMHYCGTCKTIGRSYGQKARLLLNHDTVFLAELLTVLSSQQVDKWSPAYQSWNCLSLPRDGEMPTILRYVSAITVLLSEYKVADHELDTKRRRWKWVGRLFNRTFRAARAELAFLRFPLGECESILARQQVLEDGDSGPETAAEPTAETTALVFRHGARVAGLENSAEHFTSLGYRFGQLVYLLDAWEDYDRDQKSGAFNPLAQLNDGREWAARRIRRIVTEVAAVLVELGAPDEFTQRLRANVASRLSPALPILKTCHIHEHFGLKERWKLAASKTREWKTPVWAAAAVAATVFLFPLHARLVRNHGECLSLGFNLMAVGGLMASAQSGKKTGAFRSCINSCCGGMCGDCDCDCCCDGCCDSCCECGCDGCCSSCSCDC